MAVVAVFEIHIEQKAVGIMKPSNNNRSEAPIVFKAINAIRLCKPDSSTATAIIRPRTKFKRNKNDTDSLLSQNKMSAIQVVL